MGVLRDLWHIWYDLFKKRIDMLCKGKLEIGQLVADLDEDWRQIKQDQTRNGRT